MSGRNRGSKSWIFWVIVIMACTGTLGPAIGGIFALFGTGICGLVILGIILSIIKKSKNNSNFVNADKQQQSYRDARPTKNPYSVNYSKENVERAEAMKKASSSSVVDSTYREVPVTETEPKKPAAPKHKLTGNVELDKMIIDKDNAIEEMKKLDERIEDEKLSEQIVHLEIVTEKIVQYIVAHPKKKKQVGKFFDYYLPTTMKILNAYGTMDETGISGTNIDGTKEKIEDMMDTALEAFDKQLDALYADEALDVSTDITVMQNMLKAEGLTEDEITLSL